MSTHLLSTVYGENLSTDAVLNEYPRPQLERESWQNLNGFWDYAITKSADTPEIYDGKILVPFSPEAPLSGVSRKVLPGDFLHYRLIFEHRAAEGQRTILHFGAVDERCTVFLNGKTVGSHRGGYLPFSFDITDALRSGENVLTLSVQDDSDTSFHANGKQSLRRGDIWYTAQSGIWQTVWLEDVPENYLRSLKIEPDFDGGAVCLTIDAPQVFGTALTILADGERVWEGNFPTSGFLRCILPDPHPWSPEDPFLYRLILTLPGGDKVKSYFGLRKFSVETAADGKRRLFLNGKPLFQSGTLDQGYWPDGLYTAPSDEAMIGDIAAMKRLGFNMLRKHIKIEPLRWYYHCDRLGMLVWQDMVSGGIPKHSTLRSALSLFVTRTLKDGNYRFFGREDEAGRQEFYDDMAGTVFLLYNSPCVSLWTIFNEGWGQFDSKKALEKLSALDKSRPIDHASGWHDQGIGDFLSLHVYFRKFRMKKDPRAVILSEFGGYNCHIEHHSYNDENYGYRRFPDCGTLTEAFKRLYREEIIPAKEQGLCAAVYTQLSDVEDEQNGILTYDRRICKLPETEIAALNAILTENETFSEKV